jgi:hypothetical protein
MTVHYCGDLTRNSLDYEEYNGCTGLLGSSIPNGFSRHGAFMWGHTLSFSHHLPTSLYYVLLCDAMAGTLKRSLIPLCQLVFCYSLSGGITEVAQRPGEGEVTSSLCPSVSFQQWHLLSGWLVAPADGFHLQFFFSPGIHRNFNHSDFL